MQWVHWASDSVATYYGRFPVPEVRLAVIPRAGKGVRGGTTFAARDGGFIRIHVGDETTMTDLRDDWMLTHEMVHLAFPSMAKEHHWIEEGISTYVEPIARVRAGHLDAHEMWFELVRDLHQGLPQPGDRGLDNTHTWARTYWAARYFAFLPMSKFIREPAIARGSTTRCGASSTLEETFATIGSSKKHFVLEMKQRVCRFCFRFTTR